MELWDLYGKNRKKTGLVHKRGEPLPKDGYHLTVHVWIRREDGKFLISQRSRNKSTYPLYWECVGGSVLAGEDSLQGAIRETKEEIGIDLLPQNGKIVSRITRGEIDGKRYNDVLDVWLFEWSGEVDLSLATTDEVETFRWLTVGEILQLDKQGKFVEGLKYFICNPFIK